MSNYLFKKIDFLVKSPLDGEGVCGWVCGWVVWVWVCGCVVWVAHISIVKTKKLRFFRIYALFANRGFLTKTRGISSFRVRVFGDGLKNLSFLCDTSMET